MSCGRDVAYTVRPRARHVIGLSVSSVLECWMIVALRGMGSVRAVESRGLCVAVPCLAIEWLTQGRDPKGSGLLLFHVYKAPTLHLFMAERCGSEILNHDT